MVGIEGEDITFPFGHEGRLVIEASIQEVPITVKHFTLLLMTVISSSQFPNLP